VKPHIPANIFAFDNFYLLVTNSAYQLFGVQNDILSQPNVSIQMLAYFIGCANKKITNEWIFYRA